MRRDLSVLLIKAPAPDTLPGIFGVIGTSALNAHRVNCNFRRRNHNLGVNPSLSAASLGRNIETRWRAGLLPGSPRTLVRSLGSFEGPRSLLWPLARDARPSRTRVDRSRNSPDSKISLGTRSTPFGASSPIASGCNTASYIFLVRNAWVRISSRPPDSNGLTPYCKFRPAF